MGKCDLQISQGVGKLQEGANAFCCRFPTPHFKEMQIRRFDVLPFVTVNVEASVVEWLARESTIPNGQV